MPKQLLITINFLQDVPLEDFDEVRENIGRAYTYTLLLLGVKQIQVQVQTNPIPYEEPEQKKGGG